MENIAISPSFVDDCIVLHDMSNKTDNYENIFLVSQEEMS